MFTREYDPRQFVIETLEMSGIAPTERLIAQQMDELSRIESRITANMGELGLDPAEAQRMGFIPNLTSEAVFNVVRSAPAAVVGLAAIVTPALMSASQSARDFVSDLFGNKGEVRQKRAINDFKEYQESGVVPSQGLDDLMKVTDPTALGNLMRTMTNPQSATGIQQPPRPVDPFSTASATSSFDPFAKFGSYSSYVSDITALQTLAPGMDKSTARIAVISDLPEPMPRVAEFSTLRTSDFDMYSFGESDAFSEIRNDVLRMTQQDPIFRHRQWSQATSAGTLDTDSGSTIPQVNRQTQVYAAAMKTEDERRREELINIINTANTFNENQEIELMEDEFMADLQEQRIRVNQRPVPNYSLVNTKFGGLMRPIYYSPYVQQ